MAWASAFDAREFESPEFTGRTIARLRQTFDDGAVGVKIWKNIGMSIKAKSGAFLLPDNPALLPVYEAIDRAGKTLIAHLAEPNGAWMPLDDKNPEIAYYSKNPQWHMYGKANAPDKEAILAARDRVLARYPGLPQWSVPPRERRGRPRTGWRSDSTPIPTSRSTPPPGIRYFARGDREERSAVLDPVPGPDPLRHRLRL